MVARGSAADYPYDPQAVAERLKGLDKLRAIEHRDTAVHLFSEHWVAEHNEVCRKFAVRERERAAEAGQAEVKRLKALAKAAAAGLWGQEGVGAYELILGLQRWGSEPKYDLQTLQVFERQLKESGAERVEVSRATGRR